MARYSVEAALLRLYFNRCTPTPGKNWSVDLGPDTAELLFHHVDVHASGMTRFVPSDYQPVAWIEFRDVDLIVNGKDAEICTIPKDRLTWVLGQNSRNNEIGGVPNDLPDITRL